jgi:hypothetical protein
VVTRSAFATDVAATAFEVPGRAAGYGFALVAAIMTV